MTDFIADFKDLDTSNPGLWPNSVKIVAGIVVCIATIFASWKLDIVDLRAELERLEQKEQEQIGVLERKQRKAANLHALQEQMKEIKQSFGDMLRQLPDKAEVAGLLVDISQTGLTAGLEFKLFKPSQEQQDEFYATLPIELKVVGQYHQLGEFVSGIAALPRIVTVHDVHITSTEEGSSTLVMKAIAKTYWALEQEDDLESEGQAPIAQSVSR